MRDLPVSIAIPDEEVREAKLRCILKRALRRRGIPVANETPTEQLGVLDEMAHQLEVSR